MTKICNGLLQKNVKDDSKQEFIKIIAKTRRGCLQNNIQHLCKNKESIIAKISKESLLK